MLLVLPADIVALLVPCAPLFSRPVWRHVQTLLVARRGHPQPPASARSALPCGPSGCVTCVPFRPTIASCIVLSGRAGGPAASCSACAWHRLFLLGRWCWASRRRPWRRRGKQSAAAGISRDPVRASHRHVVPVRGRRWVGLLLLVPVPWATRVWALPFLTVLASFRARGPAAAPPVQIPDDLGTAADAPSASLAARTGARRGGGPHLCGTGAAGCGPLGGDRRHPPAPRCRRCTPVRSAAAAPATSEGPPAAGRLAPPQPDAPPPEPGGGVDRPHGLRLVRRTRSPRRGALADGHVVLDGLPAGADPLPCSSAIRRAPSAPKPCCALISTPSRCTSSPGSSVAWSLRQVEGTFHEVRTHLGVETQRETDGARHPAHHSCPAGSLLPGDPAGPRCAIQLLPRDPPVRLVRQAIPDLRRRAGSGTSPPVDAHYFLRVA